MIIVTGGAGFIGSAIVSALNDRGETNILIVDDIEHDEQDHNIAPLAYERLMNKEEFRQQIKEDSLPAHEIEAIIHMGACSDTTEQDWDYLKDNNVEYTQDIIRWCIDRDVRCIYASSAAVYGNGANGFIDDHDLFNELKPLNLYGKSKLEVDIWARDAGYLDSVVGVRYFNVFGPNEYHKGDMRSVIAKKFEQAKEDNIIELFKSYNEDYRDGEQERDFIYVKDAVDATLFFLDRTVPGGVYNIGTGVASTWNDVANGIFDALDAPAEIKYVDMPKKLKDQYQYHTQADIAKLKAAGYSPSFWPLTDAIGEYVKAYLVPHKHLGE